MLLLPNSIYVSKSIWKHFGLKCLNLFLNFNISIITIPSLSSSINLCSNIFTILPLLYLIYLTLNYRFHSRMFWDFPYNSSITTTNDKNLSRVNNYYYFQKYDFQGDSVLLQVIICHATNICQASMREELAAWMI